MTDTELNDLIKPRSAQKVTSAKDLQANLYMVYILTFNGAPIVVGHGKRNRAKVIFDDENNITSGHIKALTVRMHRLFGTGEFGQYIIECKNKPEAGEIEKEIHGKIGGNTRELPRDIRDALFKDIEPNSCAHMVLKMALVSSFDGISDLKLWRKRHILDDDVWKVAGGRLKLTDPLSASSA